MFDYLCIARRLQSRQHTSYPERMPVSAHDVAAEVRRRLPGMGTKKLHKLLYYCQGHHLAIFDEPLFSETISAWDMGPVVGALWRQEKDGHAPQTHAELDEAALNTIGYVISRYGGLTGNDLENLTHSEAPWQTADRYRRPKTSARIELGWIRDYFRSSGAADGDDEVVLDSAAITELLKDADQRRKQPRRPDDLDEIRARLTARG